MTSNIFVFDRNIIRQKRSRCAAHLNEHGFLFDWAVRQTIERLDIIKRKFPLALQIGNRAKSPDLSEHGVERLITFDCARNLSPDVIGDEEILPFAANTFDLILSPLSLHSTNDLPGTLSQIRNALKPDGLFIGTLFGGETLYELRQVMNQVEMQQYGGASPRIAPFADLPQMGSLMQRAGFNLPVIDSEIITVSYENVFKLMNDLRLMGEGNILKTRRKNFTGRDFFANVNKAYHDKFPDTTDRIKSSFEIIFLIGWKPHESQQKPLKPGSATARLADILKSEEEKLPC